RTQQLMEKLRQAGIPLGEYVEGKIYYGIKTGYNEAFVIDEATKDQLIAEDPKSAEVIKPFLAGRDIKRYEKPTANKHLIFTRRGIEIEKYPAILKHLEQYRKQLEPRPKNWKGKTNDWPGRKPGTYKWFEIQDAVDYHEEFEKPKIMLPDIALKAECLYDYGGYYCVNTAYILPTEKTHLLGILNSTLVHFYYSNITSSIRGGYLRFIRQYLEQIPIKKDNLLSSKIRQKVEHITMLKQSTPASSTLPLEAEIDLLVYKLYGLSWAEVKVVDPEFGMSEAAYGEACS
ncbi:MAG: hypothetical protein KDD04_08835, partial [Sinomicrobium sp.]|nr:hypothetical protein [Sinomicrobium sp.]